MLNSFYTCAKNNLFDCKAAVSIKLLPKIKKQEKKEVIFNLKRELMALEKFVRILREF